MNWFYDAHFDRAVKVWPSEPVVAFFEPRRERFVEHPILDHGCGAGRHSIYMARRGANVFGIDYSAVGIRHARQWARREGLALDLRTGDFTGLPYPDACFSGLISWESAFYGDENAVRRTVAEALRVLQADAPFLIMLKSTDDFRFTRARIGETRCCESGHDLPMTCLTRDETRRLFDEAARDVTVETLAFSMNDGRDLVSNHLVYGTRR